jgi:hypothetical protein
MYFLFEVVRSKNGQNVRGNISRHRNGHIRLKELWLSAAVLGFKSPVPYKCQENKLYAVISETED